MIPTEGSGLPVVLELEKLYAFRADLVLVLHAHWLGTLLDAGRRGGIDLLGEAVGLRRVLGCVL